MADTYGDIEGFKAWADARGHAYPSEDSEIQSALVRATGFIESAYRLRWKGKRTSTSQPLAWPRTGVRDEDGVELDDDTIPQQVIDAAYEAARRVLEGVDLQPDTPGRAVTSESVKAGPVETTTSYSDKGSGRPSFIAIDTLLSGLLRGKLSLVWLERV